MGIINDSLDVRSKHSEESRIILTFGLFYAFNHIDIDECGGNPCHANASCENIVGSFICRCDEEFTGDGFDCTGEK